MKKKRITDSIFKIEDYLDTVETELENIAWILNYLARPVWVDLGTGRQRVNVETGNLSSIGSLSTLAGFSIKDTLLRHAQEQAWLSSIRSRIN